VIGLLNVAAYAAFAVIGGFVGLVVSVALFMGIEIATRRRIRRLKR